MHHCLDREDHLLKMKADTAAAAAGGGGECDLKQDQEALDEWLRRHLAESLYDTGGGSYRSVVAVLRALNRCW